MIAASEPATSGQALALPVGFKLFWYEIRAILGQGGFGITYLAHDTNLDQLVAIKEYLPAVCATRGKAHTVVPISVESGENYEWGLGRFLEEGRVLAKFDHQSVVRVHSVFEALETAYLVMRYERGETLDALLKREHRMDEPRLHAILLDVMSGLEAMHAAGFVHRDVKPSNIYLRANGQALLIDFGAARQALGVQTQTVTSLVSPGYAPFEQYRSDGAAQGPWTDIYGLGATAYKVITGHAPMSALDRSHRIIDGHGDAQPWLTQSGVTGYRWGLLAAIDRALAFREHERPRTIAAWRKLFETEEPATAAVGNPPLPLTGTIPAPVCAIDSHPEMEVSTLREPPTHAPDPLLSARRRRRSAAAFGVLVGTALGFALLKFSSNVVSPPAIASPVSQPRAETIAEPIAKTDTRTARPAPVAPTDIRNIPLALLLQAAKADMEALRLTVPEDNNALAKFRAVLARDAGNRAAESGIDRIVGRYLDLATSAAQKQDFDAARDFLSRASLADPLDRRIDAAHDALNRHQARANSPSGWASRGRER